MLKIHWKLEILLFAPMFYTIIFMQCDDFRLLITSQFSSSLIQEIDSFLLNILFSFQFFLFEAFYGRIFCPLTGNFYLLALFSSYKKQAQYERKHRVNKLRIWSK